MPIAADEAARTATILTFAPSLAGLRNAQLQHVAELTAVERAHDAIQYPEILWLLDDVDVHACTAEVLIDLIAALPLPAAATRQYLSGLLEGRIMSTMATGQKSI